MLFERKWEEGVMRKEEGDKGKESEEKKERKRKKKGQRTQGGVSRKGSGSDVTNKEKKRPHRRDARAHAWTRTSVDRWAMLGAG